MLTEASAPWPIGTLLHINCEEHMVDGYSKKYAYVTLMRAMGWPVEYSLDYIMSHQTPAASSVVRFIDRQTA